MSFMPRTGSMNFAIRVRSRPRLLRLGRGTELEARGVVRTQEWLEVEGRAFQLDAHARCIAEEYLQGTRAAHFQVVAGWRQIVVEPLAVVVVDLDPGSGAQDELHVGEIPVVHRHRGHRL